MDHILLMENTSAAETTAKTGLSAATVSRIITFLRRQDLIIETGRETAEMGRPTSVFGVNPKYGYFLHFYVGSGYMKTYLTDFSGKQLQESEESINRAISIQNFSQKLREKATELCKRENIDYSKLLLAGISIPGMVDEKNDVVRRIPNYINFNNESMRKYAEEALEIPVIINNEARLCATGEYISEFKDCDNLIYMDFTEYSGIGAGIILNGELYAGKNNVAGEVGDMLADVRSFYGGAHEDEGCLEVAAGVGTMFDKFYVMMSRGRAPILKEILTMNDTEVLNISHIEQAVLMQDLDVVDVFDETMRLWAVAIVNIATVLDPDVLLLGGVVGVGNDVILARINHYVSKILYYDTNIRLGNSHERAQYNGGIHLLKSYFFNHFIAERLFT